MKRLYLFVAVAFVSLAVGCGGKQPEAPSAPLNLESKYAGQGEGAALAPTDTDAGSATGTGTLTVTKTATSTTTQTGTSTYTATITKTETQTQTSTATGTVTLTTTRTATAFGTFTKTVTRSATSTETKTLTSVLTYQQNYVVTGTITSTNTLTVYYTSWPRTKGTTATATSTYVLSGTGRAPGTATVLGSANGTETKTVSAIVTGTGHLTGTFTVPVTATATSTVTYAGGGSRTLTATGTGTNTATLTWTYHPRGTVTQTTTTTRTVTVFGTQTVTKSSTSTATQTTTTTSTVTASSSPTVTLTGTNTSTVTQTTTVTATATCGSSIRDNLLQNGDFDGGLSGWTAPLPGGVPEPLASYDETQDAGSCPTSGSVRMTYYGFAFGSVNQCVPATGNTTYQLGFKYQQAGTGTDAAMCIVTYHAGTGCAGDGVGAENVGSGAAVGAGVWGTKVSNFVTPASAGSIRVSCQSNSLSEVWVDQVWLKVVVPTGNLLQNGGFNGGLSGWTVPSIGGVPEPLATYDATKDGDSASTSGSVRMTYYGFAFGGVNQCVPATGSTTYQLGFKYQQAGTGADAAMCIVTYHAGTGCAGDGVGAENIGSGAAVGSGVWGTKVSNFVTPASAGSIRVSCQSNSLSEVWVDQVWLKVVGPTGNLLQNGGFNGGLSGWTVPSIGGVPEPLATYDATKDVDSASTSGSVRMTYYGFAFGSVNQCVPATGSTTYQLGFKYQQAGTGADAAMCIVTYHAGTGCAGDGVGAENIGSGAAVGAGVWGTKVSNFVTAASAGSIRVSCQSNSLSEVWVDQVWLKVVVPTGNLLQNGGFNGGLSGWTVPSIGGVPEPLATYDATKDVDSSSTSGSVRMTYYGFAFGSVNQCVPATGSTTYQLGFKYQQAGTGADAAMCIVTYHAGTGCAGDGVGAENIGSGAAVGAGVWGTKVSNFVTPASAGSIRVSCQSNSLSEVWVDQAWLKVVVPSGNLLQNGGFNGGLSGWTVPSIGGVPEPLATYDATKDVDSSSTSGSVRMTYYGFAFGSVNQCVPATGSTTYQLGFKYQQAGTGADAAMCIVTYHAGTGCAGDGVGAENVGSGAAVGAGVWGTKVSNFVTPASAGSIRVSCQSNSLSEVWVDQVWLKVVVPTGNLLQNGGFNGGLSGWTVPSIGGVPEPLATYDGTKDVDSSSTSGSVRMTYYGFAFGSVNQCVPATGSTTYQLGFKYQQAGTGADAAMCIVTYQAGTGCAGDGVGAENVGSGAAVGAGVWGTKVSNFVTPASAGSIRVSCQSNSLSEVWVDQAWLKVVVPTGNLLQNGGFNGGLSGWTVPSIGGVPEPLATYDATKDVDSSSTSGSVRMTYYGFAFGSVNQCVPATGSTTYQLGFKYQQAGTGADAAMCIVTYHAGTGCAGDGVGAENVGSGAAVGAGVWGTKVGNFVTPASAGSIRVSCQSNSLSEVWVDQVWLKIPS